MNKKPFEIANVSVTEYKNWCKANNRAFSKKENRKDFFERIVDGRLVRDSLGNLVRKNRRG